MALHYGGDGQGGVVAVMLRGGGWEWDATTNATEEAAAATLASALLALLSSSRAGGINDGPFVRRGCFEQEDAFTREGRVGHEEDNDNCGGGG